MKRLHCVRLLIALASAAILSACGGSDVNGDLYVSVQQFESGGAGFWLSGTGGNLRVVSTGTGTNSDIINVKAIGTNMQGPYDVVASAEDTSEKVTPAGWEDLGKIGDQSKIVSGRLTADGQTLTSISAMIYSVEAGGQRAHLSMTFTLQTGSTDTSLSQALAGFFGCTSSVARTNNNNGNSNYYGSYWQYNNGNRRVVFPDSSGVSIQAWLDFTTGHAVVQMVGAVANDDTSYSDNTLNGGNYNYYRYNQGPTIEGAIFTASNAIFRKIIN